MSAKNQAILFSFAVLIILMIVCILLISSCYAKPKQGVPSFIINLTEQGGIIVLNQTNQSNESKMTIANQENKTTNITANKTEEKEAEKQKTQEATQEQPYVRANAVEFYFLLKEKSYFKDILKEQQKKTYNLPDSLVTIEPIIITSDSAKFMVNNYTTKALHKHEWGSDDDFEIYVNEIYYIG
jgi:hypothetical protein